MKNPAFKARSRSGSRVSKKATSYRKEGELIIFRLYGIDIVSVGKNSIVLDSGGYKTVITKRRMNQISKELDLGFYVYAKKGVWWVAFHTGFGRDDAKFYDGMGWLRS